MECDSVAIVEVPTGTAHTTQYDATARSTMDYRPMHMLTFGVGAFSRLASCVPGPL